MFAALCLVGEMTGLARAQCQSPCQATEWSRGTAIGLGGLPGSISSEATGINEAGRVVG
jgi:hypothetical protein